MGLGTGLRTVRRLVLLAIVALVLAAPAQAADAVDRGASYLESRQQADGGFAEPGSSTTPGLTAWAALGLAAAGRAPDGAAAYLTGQPYPTAIDLALRVLALDALGRDTGTLAGRLAGLRRANGAIGPSINSSVWAAIALRSAGMPVAASTVGFIRRSQTPSGGWSWQAGLAPDTDDTAAAVQALRAAGVSCRSKTVRRGLAFLRARQNRDGGFELEEGKGSNAQSTAWAMQAFIACGRDPGEASRSYLRRLQRSDGSFRYSARYATTPVWVTSYVVAALAGRAFPL